MMSRCRDCSAPALRDASGPTLGLTCAAGGRKKRDERRHGTRMKNAPGLGPRQRRQVQAMLGGNCIDIYELLIKIIFYVFFNYQLCPVQLTQKFISI